MPELIPIVLVLIIGIVTGFLDAIAGGGGLVAIPFLIFMGLPPQVAIATDRFGILGTFIGSFPKYLKEKKIVWKYVFPFIVIGLLGSYLGAKLLLETSNESLPIIVGVILLLLLPAILFLRKDFGVTHKNVTTLRSRMGYFVLFLVMIFAGYFSGGSGILSVYVMMFFFGLTIIESSATGIITGILGTIVTVIVFAFAGVINYGLGIILLIGMMIGGYLGAHTAIRKGDAWVKIVFAIIVVVSATKLLFFS